MRKIVKMFAMAVLMMMCGQTMAQTRGVFSLGPTFPMKDFAAFDGNVDKFALTGYDENDAGAGIGFNAGLKWYFNVGVEGLNVLLSIDGFYSGPNADLKNAYRNKETEIGNSILNGSFKYNSTPKIINVPAMLGVNYIYHFNPNLGIFVEAGAGGNLRFITNLETVSKVTVASVETKQVITNDYEKAFSFAYQAGLGIEVAKNLVIGCSFYDLGKASVNMTERKKTVVNNGTPDNYTDHKELGIVHPVMVLGRIGFSF